MDAFNRFIEGCEFRAKDKPVFSGIGAVFYDGTPETEFKLADGLVERFSPTAFDAFLKTNGEVISLYDHKDDRLLARRSSGTLRLFKSDKGLHYEFDVDQDDLDHKDIVSKFNRGHIKGSSVTFKAEARGQRFIREGSKTVRDLVEVNLFELGPTWKPCYGATTAELRSLQSQISSYLIEPPTPLDFWILTNA